MYLTFIVTQMAVAALTVSTEPWAQRNLILSPMLRTPHSGIISLDLATNMARVVASAVLSVLLLETALVSLFAS